MPRTLPAKSCRAMSRAHLAPPFQRRLFPHAPVDRRELPSRRRDIVEADREVLRQAQQIGKDRRHRLGCLAVEPVRVALPHPDDVREPVVAQLDDDRRHAVARARGPSGRSGTGRGRSRCRTSWVTVQAHRPATHGRASTRLADGRPEPVRAEPVRVVGRQPGLGRDRRDEGPRLVVVAVERGVERDRHDLRRAPRPRRSARAGR